MLTFDIPINIRVNAETEQQAEDLVENFMLGLHKGPALTDPFITWDFIEFVSEDEPDSEFFMGS